LSFEDSIKIKISLIFMDKILNRINFPEDVRQLDKKGLETLAGEIRDKLISTVARTGGHLGPNLGTVELTLALHCAFDTPRDKIIWDVGHQTYTHKLITGRREEFETLRQFEGCSGFPTPGHSEYDCFIAGHAGTAISAATGMKAAAERSGRNEQVVAVVGDGAFNCGISLEGLNNAGASCRGLIVILNDNKMSIASNVGALARHLNRLISANGYIKLRASIRNWIFRLRRGKSIHRFISRMLRWVKNLILPGSVFEVMGFRYLGPIDGHDIELMIRTFEAAKNSSRPVLVHVITGKGKGYLPAEEAPEKFHGVPAFDPVTGKSSGGGKVTFSQAFGKSMIAMAERYPELVTITAGMAYGTGLREFSSRFPRRFFDVGIAEEHAAVFAAGLAVGGLRPVYAIYATFMQRALDCLFHDVCLQNLPVIFAVDRAGVVEDGCTHHGIHDLGFMRTLPNLTIMAPADKNELEIMFEFAWKLATPVVIRYPRGSAEPFGADTVQPLTFGRSLVVREGGDVALWAWGRELETALKIADTLAGKGVAATVVNARFLKPFDSTLLRAHAAAMPIVTLEDTQIGGGLAAQCDAELVNCNHKGISHFGWGDGLLEHGAPEKLRKKYGFTVDAVVETVANMRGVS